MNEELEIKEESLMTWRSLAGYAYILICIFDFMIMPVVINISISESRSEIIRLLEEENGGETTIDEITLKILDKTIRPEWKPTTLAGGGLFHLSFGAILTGAAVTRGFERKEIVKKHKSKKQND